MLEGRSAHADPEPVGSVGVLIPSHDRPALLARALDGVARQTRLPDEVLVVVRRDDAETMSVATNAPSSLPVRVVDVDAPGLVAARNAGLASATTDVLAFLDDDAVPEPDWLERMLVHYDDPGVGAVGGRDQIYHGDREVSAEPLESVGLLARSGRWVALHHRGSGTARDVDHLKGVNMSIRRSRFPDLRVDEELRGRGAQVHEDSSLVLQVKRRGHRVVYDPSIRVHHYEADRGDGDPRSPTAFRARSDRQHNQTFVICRYYPAHRAVVHVLFSILVGTREAPGLAVTVHDLVAQRRLRGHLVPLAANVVGRLAGVRTALRARGRTGPAVPPS